MKWQKSDKIGLAMMLFGFAGMYVGMLYWLPLLVIGFIVAFIGSIIFNPLDIFNIL